MKRLLSSFKFYTGHSGFMDGAKLFLCAVVGVFAVMLVDMVFMGEEYAPSVNSIMSICALSGGVIAVIMLNVLYSFNYRDNPGYKYFHSADPNGKRFIEALIFANIMGAALGAAIFAIASLLEIYIDSGIKYISAAVTLGMMGVANLTGYIKRKWIRILIIVPFSGIIGFFVGMSVAPDEPEFELPFPWNIIALIIGTGFFAAGIIYTVNSYKKKWGGDNE